MICDSNILIYAIIAATALEYAVPPVTRNESHFKHIPGLQIINPFAAGIP